MEAVKMRELVKFEERRNILVSVKSYFLAGALDWISHPEYVEYNWVVINRRLVQATAIYRGEEYRGVVRIIPKFRKALFDF